jgi:hypothetical protein
MKRFFLVLALITMGCQQDHSPLSIENTSSSVLIPLELGNEWLVKRTSFDSLGTITDSDTILCTVEYDTTFLNEKWYKTFWGFINNKEDGIWRYYGGSSNIHGVEYSSSLSWKYPASVNHKYKPIGANSVITVMSLDENYTTPTNTFKCYHYQLVYDNTIDYKQDYYICPGIGRVMWEDSITLPSGKSYTTGRYELLSYTIR